MSGVWFLIATGFLIAIGVVVTRSLSAQHRATERSDLAKELGFRSASVDPFATAELPFRLFAHGDERGVEHVVWGSWRGLEVRAFEFWSQDERRVHGRTVRSRSRWSCALVPVDIACPPTTIEWQVGSQRAADDGAASLVRTGSERFDRAFRVRSRDPRFAAALIDASMAAWLIAEAAGCSFELAGRRMLCCVELRPSRELPTLLAVASGFIERFPAAARSLYPPDASG